MSKTNLNPTAWFNEREDELLEAVNRAAINLNKDLTDNTPTNFGLLRQSWVLSLANKRNKTAVIGNSRNYLLPVEIGRAPGKGISREGQNAVALWAKRKGLENPESFPYLLSEKYKREGRPAVGFMGLAQAGTIPSSSGIQENYTPIPGSLIQQAFDNLQQDLNSI